MRSSVGDIGKIRLFLPTQVEDLIYPEGLVVVAGLDILRMKAPSIEYYEPVGSHINQFQ